MHARVQCNYVLLHACTCIYERIPVGIRFYIRKLYSVYVDMCNVLVWMYGCTYV